MGSAAEQVLKPFADNPAMKDMVDRGKDAAAALSDHATKLFDKLKQPRACVKDHDGYVVCGPIVGYERPSEGGMSGTLHENKVKKDRALSNTPKEK